MTKRGSPATPLELASKTNARGVVGVGLLLGDGDWVTVGGRVCVGVEVAITVGLSAGVAVTVGSFDTHSPRMHEALATNTPPLWVQPGRETGPSQTAAGRKRWQQPGPVTMGEIVGVADGPGVSVGVIERVRVDVEVRVTVGVSVAVWVVVRVGVRVLVRVRVTVGVLVGGRVAVIVGVGVMVLVTVIVGVSVGVRVLVAVAVIVGVAGFPTMERM